MLTILGNIIALIGGGLLFFLMIISAKMPALPFLLIFWLLSLFF